MDKVLIKATPVNNRFRDALAGEYQGSDQPAIHEPDFIPSSGLRGGHKRSQASPHVASTPRADRIQATPVRPPTAAGIFSKLPLPDIVENSSPLQARRPSQVSAVDKAALAVQATINFIHASSPMEERNPAEAMRLPLSSGIAQQSDDFLSPGLGSLFETPVKTKSRVDVTGGSPWPRAFEPTRPSGEKDLTIFQKLGWDEEDIDELSR